MMSATNFQMVQQKNYIYLCVYKHADIHMHMRKGRERERESNSNKCQQLVNIGEGYMGVHCTILLNFLKV